MEQQDVSSRTRRRAPGAFEAVTPRGQQLAPLSPGPRDAGGCRVLDVVPRVCEAVAAVGHEVVPSKLADDGGGLDQGPIFVGAV